MVKRTILIVAAVAGLTELALLAMSWAGRPEMSETKTESSADATAARSSEAAKLAKATFGTGCFWCTEAVFDQLKGVKSVVSGYSGGPLPNPTYEQVCSGQTGHAEVVQITYDPAVISFPDLLEVFWQTHDPTTLNRQGHDVGTQYRSAIFYHDQSQRELAEHYKQKLTESGAFRDPIVTEITPYKDFYPAEKDHQDYFALNPTQAYCSNVIRPKIDKFKKAFGDKLKEAPKSPAAARP